MEAEHTPAPWKFLEAEGRIEGPGTTVIAFISGEAWDQAIPNARLIAAAPELLEVLVAYKFHHKLLLQVTSDVDCPCKICQMADAVIRKAKGE